MDFMTKNLLDKVNVWKKEIKEDKKLSLDLLPKGFNIDEVAINAFKKGVLFYERIGIVNIWINMVITKTIGKDGKYKIEIDKFAYEKDGHSLKSVVDSSLENL